MVIAKFSDKVTHNYYMYSSIWGVYIGWVAGNGLAGKGKI